MTTIDRVAGTALLEALPVAIYMTDAEGRIVFYNEAAAAMWGNHPEPGAKWCGSWRLYHADGKPMAHEDCPMAVTLRDRRPVRGAESILERPDGRKVRFQPWPSLLTDETGAVVGAINLLIDITDRREADIDLARLAAIVSTSNDAIISKTLEGRITSWNTGAGRIFGYTADEMVGQPITKIIPPELHGEERDILARLSRGEMIDHYETVRVAKDGRRLDISLTVSPLRDPHGTIIGASKVARDVTERRRLEIQQRLLVDELNHRVRNTMATVQAIATQSLARALQPQDFVQGFTGRLHALAKAHSLLTETHFQNAEIDHLIREQVLLASSDDRRISASGPRVSLDAQLALHLGMVLHELATNARKHGALSVPGGRLEIGWEIHTEPRRSLVLSWKEWGGPAVMVPESYGFGMSLIERTLKSHGGETRIQFAAHGITCLITVPLPDMTATEGRRFGLSGVGSSLEELAARELGQRNLVAKRVLIVEDEPLIAMDIEGTLSAHGYSVVGPAGTLEGALKLVEQGGFDAALIDANLDGDPVDELAGALAAKGIAFAFVTGYGLDTLPSVFVGTPVLEKPFFSEQLLDLVGRLVNPGAAVVQLRQRN
ncbi:MAG: PAS domain S-box protein [Aestuariivirgaceae bacterium]